MVEFKLHKLSSDEESDFLSTHFFGCPDVPSVWNDDAVFFNDEVFLGQINLKDIDDSKEGILYFFIQVESHPYRGIVRYTKDTDTCERIDFNDEITDDLDIDFEVTKEAGEVKYLSENLPKESKVKSNEIVLLQVSKDILSSKVFKDLKEDLFFVVSKNDFENNNFSKAHLTLSVDD